MDMMENVYYKWKILQRIHALSVQGIVTLENFWNE